MERDNYQETEAKKRIAAQLPLSDKCDKSHFVVDNSDSREETRKQVEKIIASLKSSKHHIAVRIYLAALIASVTFVISCVVYVIYFLLLRRRF